MNIGLFIGVGWLIMALIMSALWLVQRLRHNAGIVDIAWSFGTGLMAVWFAWGVDGDPARRLLVGTLAGIWGLRLGFYLLRRIMSEPEDGRYQAMRERWGARTQPYLFAFFQIQAFWRSSSPCRCSSRPATRRPGWSGPTGSACSSGSSPSVASRSRTGSSAASAGIRTTAARSAARVCGGTRVIRTTSSSGCTGSAYVPLALGSEPVGGASGGCSRSAARRQCMLFLVTKVTGIPLRRRRSRCASRGEDYRALPAHDQCVLPLAAQGATRS